MDLPFGFDVEYRGAYCHASGYVTVSESGFDEDFEWSVVVEEVEVYDEDTGNIVGVMDGWNRDEVAEQLEREGLDRDWVAEELDHANQAAEDAYWDAKMDEARIGDFDPFD